MGADGELDVREPEVLALVKDVADLAVVDARIPTKQQQAAGVLMVERSELGDQFVAADLRIIEVIANLVAVFELRDAHGDRLALFFVLLGVLGLE